MTHPHCWCGTNNSASNHLKQPLFPYLRLLPCLSALCLSLLAKRFSRSRFTFTEMTVTASCHTRPKERENDSFLSLLVFSALSAVKCTVKIISGSAFYILLFSFSLFFFFGYRLLHNEIQSKVLTETKIRKTGLVFVFLCFWGVGRGVFNKQHLPSTDPSKQWCVQHKVRFLTSPVGGLAASLVTAVL